MILKQRSFCILFVNITLLIVHKFSKISAKIKPLFYKILRGFEEYAMTS